MDIRFYNTLSRQLETFVPLQPGRVRMYTCGLTVYDYGHIGNFRTFLAVDILQRFLATEGYDVDSVMNITDVDDKMIQRSREAGRELRDYADTYTQAFLEDLDRLEIRRPRHLVRATDHIADMIAWIERLIATGHAYEREGSVYFRLASFPAYGRLSGKDLGGLQSGARVDVDEYEKEEARDFVLWKAWKEGEPFWESPWGRGRPGWHIECSVMSMKILGESFDIHAGGTDLVFPHHENEIAQAEAVTGKPFVRYWIHSEFLLVNGEKMSKRLGNFYTLRDLMAQGFRPSAVRYLLVATPYRKQLNFTLEGLHQATAAVDRLRNFRDRLAAQPNEGEADQELEAAAVRAHAAMRAALADNLNTAEAVAAIFELVKLGNTALDEGRFRPGNRPAFDCVLAAFDAIFGVLGSDDHAKLMALGAAAERLSDAEVEARLEARAQARQARDFARADALRAELDAAGVLVEDVKGGGVRWRWK